MTDIYKNQVHLHTQNVKLRTKNMQQNLAAPMGQHFYLKIEENYSICNTTKSKDAFHFVSIEKQYKNCKFCKSSFYTPTTHFSFGIDTQF
jgi:hypothetical protein